MAIKLIFLCVCSLVSLSVQLVNRLMECYFIVIEAKSRYLHILYCYVNFTHVRVTIRHVSRSQF